MKKLLSILLALAVAAGLALPAMAEPEPQGLMVEPQTVTALKAEWDGTIAFDWGIRFNPENVTVTLTYDDDSEEALDYWSAYNGEFWWEVEYIIKDGEVIFYYRDSTWDWTDIDDLPQGSFSLPENLFKLVTGAIPLELDKAQNLTETTLLIFTPEEDGWYEFRSSNRKGEDCDPRARLYAPDMSFMAYNNDSGGDWNFLIAAQLKKGQTYGLEVRGIYQGGADVTVTKTERTFRLTANEIVVRYGTTNVIWLSELIERNDYGANVLINGESVCEDYYDEWNWYYGNVFVTADKPGEIMTLTFTLKDGTVLGEVNVVCKLTTLQWVSYYLLGGFLWMPKIPSVDAWTLAWTLDDLPFNTRVANGMLLFLAAFVAPLVAPLMALFFVLRSAWFGAW